MEVDPSQSQSIEQKVEMLQNFNKGPFSSSIAKLSGSSRGIPSEKDFHYYNNFDEFRAPAMEIAQESQAMLEMVGASSHMWGKEMVFPNGMDDAYDSVVDANDEVFERMDVSMDDFRRLRKKEEETGVRMISSSDADDGFQLVYGKKKKGLSQSLERSSCLDTSNPSAVKVASRDRKTDGLKPKIPFHIPSIPRPQDEFRILANNANQPFEHVWLQRSEDGSRFIHPLEKHSLLDFVDKNVGDSELVKPAPLESTPFKLVEEVKDLKELAAKLRDVDEFAVDLEHNSYRSFQGLTCLMQVSTRSEDFVVDTLKLRIHVGPYLREVFKDPSKRKVMHGADRDIMWLQRDFGIYVCNMFDTGQASRVLKLERNSLEYLLSYFCGVTANKEYQNADWRLRPLPEEMLRYAREDTHYLLHIYDVMKSRLLSTSSESGTSDDLLVEVYKRSYDICAQLYEKELLTESSYLYIYGLQDSDLNSKQLAVVAGLCEWRDVIARAEDESTGYILPNRTLLEIAKQMPFTASKLRRLLRSKHPYIERNLNDVINIIKYSIQNSAAFDAVAEHLKLARMETAAEENVAVAIDSEDLPSTETSGALNTSVKMEEIGGNNAPSDVIPHLKEEAPDHTSTVAENGIVPITGATVQMLRKPSRAFGALLGSSATKRKFDTTKKEVKMLEQIKSSVNLPFHYFSGRDERLHLAAKEATVMVESSDREPKTEPDVTPKLGDIILLDDDSDTEESKNAADPEEATIMVESSDREPKTEPDVTYKLVDIILLDDDSDVEESENAADTEEAKEDLDLPEKSTTTPGSTMEMDDGEELSLTDLSSSFRKCFPSLNQARQSRQVAKPQDPGGFLQLKPFDYEAARKQNSPAADGGNMGGAADLDEIRRRRQEKKGDKKKSASVIQKEESGDFAQGRRRQAFPSTGNRSATFR